MVWLEMMNICCCAIGGMNYESDVKVMEDVALYCYFDKKHFGITANSWLGRTIKDLLCFWSG